MIRVLLLTGFLGSGKTTLLSGLVAACRESGGKPGVIMNEFGDRDVDGVLIGRGGAPFTGLVSGSVFCSCIKADFVKALIDMSREDISLLLIEASGLADPASMGAVLASVAPHTEKPYHYLGSVCIADAATFPEMAELLPSLRSQAEYASALIINRADIAGSEAAQGALCALRELNPSAPAFITNFCRVDLQGLLALLGEGEKAPRESLNTPESRPFSMVLTPAGEADASALLAFFERIAPCAYRMKGFLKTHAGPHYLSAVGDIVELEPWSLPLEEDEFGVVLISRVGISLVSRVTAALGESGLRESLAL